MIDILSWLLLVSGGLVGIVGAVGIHRFPDFYSRQHAAGITDTLCAMLILLGLVLQAGLNLAAFKLVLIFMFLFFTSPTTSHALANAARHSGLKPEVDSTTIEDRSRD
ncbi:MAG: monovalent cation/H(+) antiporter subunit G [Gammaproteobacteria bacterium]|nr:monovalent cation/H(+) antiporter subunit G [Gammaproteobacteria bacterium]